MPVTYNAQPTNPQPKRPLDFNGLGAMEWITTAQMGVNRAQTGWSGMNEALRNNKVFLFDENNQPQVYNNTKGFSSNNLTEMRKLIQASAEGRLCIRHKDTDALMQLKTLEVGSANCVLTLSEPMEKLPDPIAGEPMENEAENEAENELNESSSEINEDEVEKEGEAEIKEGEEAKIEGEEAKIEGEEPKAEGDEVEFEDEGSEMDEEEAEYAAGEVRIGTGRNYRGKISQEAEERLFPEADIRYQTNMTAKQAELLNKYTDPKNSNLQPIAEAAMEKPESPSWWKYVLHAIFGMYEQEFAEYQQEMELYNAQTVHDVLPRSEAPKKAAPKEADVQISEVYYAFLEDAVKNPKPLDKRIAGHESAGGLANECYQQGLRARKDLLDQLREGNFEYTKNENPDRVYQTLGDIMLGEMVRRCVKNGDKDAFYRQVEQHGDQKEFFENWGERLLNTPAAKNLLNGSKEDMARAIGYQSSFEKLMNSAISEANDMEKNPEKYQDQPIKTNELKQDEKSMEEPKVPSVVG